MTALDRRLAVATELAQQAGALALRMRPPPGAPAGTLKGAQDWLTEADGAVEAFLAERLAAAFPDDGFEGEEGGKSRAGGLRWVVDPIDGTANYARGSPRFCVSLGLLDGPAPLVGVIVAPALGETFRARHGGGATLNGTPIRAAATTDLTRATIECGWSTRRSNADFWHLAQSVMETGAILRASGSGALGLADVACGRIDAYAELHINLWDVAAALCLLAEAGAITTDFTKDPGQTNGNPILACAPDIALAVGGALGAPFSEEGGGSAPRPR